MRKVPWPHQLLPSDHAPVHAYCCRTTDAIPLMLSGPTLRPTCESDRGTSSALLISRPPIRNPTPPTSNWLTCMVPSLQVHVIALSSLLLLEMGRTMQMAIVLMASCHPAPQRGFRLQAAAPQISWLGPNYRYQRSRNLTAARQLRWARTKAE